MGNKMKGSLLLLVFGEYDIKDSNGIDYKYRLGFAVIDMTVMLIVYKDLEQFYKHNYHFLDSQKCENVKQGFEWCDSKKEHLYSYIDSMEHHLCCEDSNGEMIINKILG